MRVLAMALLLTGAGVGAHAHDPSAYGGLFRSRNLGETWLNADVGLFLNAALTQPPNSGVARTVPFPRAGKSIFMHQCESSGVCRPDSLC